MKVIDLLNKIANGEEVPKKVKYEDMIFEYENGDYYIELENADTYTMLEHLTFNKNYNNREALQLELEEVEIIEEDKKIRKLDFIEENTFSKRQNGMTSEDRRLLDSNFKELGIKINEIIDYLEENK